MIQDGLKALLLADATVSGLISDRLYPVVLPRGYQYPACVFHTFSKSADYSFEGPTDNLNVSLQVDSYGASYSSSRQVADAIEAVLMPYVGTLSDGTVVKLITLTQDMDMSFLPSADVTGITYRVMQQFRIVYNDPS